MSYIENIKGKSIKVGSGKWKIKPEKYDELFSLRENGVSYAKIAEKYNVNYKTISTIFKKFGLIGKGNRIYNIKHDWLNNLDCKEKFYFLGYFWADGTIERNLRIAKIELAEEDKYILNKFASLIYEGEYKLYPDFHDFNKYKNRQKKWSLKFYSNEFCSKLNEFGCVPNKSLIVRLPKFFKSDDDFWHFVRGLFDGDGCVSGKIINIVGSDFLCQELNNYFKKYKINMQIYKKEKNSVIYSGSIIEINKIYKYLYKDSENLRLERKFLKFKILSNRNIKKFPIHILDFNNGNHLFSFQSIKDCAIYFSISESTIKKYIKNKTIINNYILSR